MKKQQFRLMIVALGILFLLSTLISQFFSIQILNGEHWAEVARRQHFFVVNEPFSRGSFWSNTDIRKIHPDEPQRFVVEIQKYHLYIDPESIPAGHRDPIAAHLADSLEYTSPQIALLKEQFEKKSRSRKIATWLDLEMKDKLNLWWNGYAAQYKIPRNALYFVGEYQRSYPFGKLLGQVLHTVQLQRDEITKQAFPTGGLELAFDPWLQGKQGKRLLKRSPRHSFETGTILVPPEDGADIHLTINHYLQAIAEEEIEKGVKACNARSGWAVMMNPHTGEILALAQYPFFYPSQYNSYFNDPELIEDTKVKAVTDTNEPGSVVKALTVLAALIANEELKARGEPPLFDPEEKMPCSDSKFPGRSKPLTDVTFHKFLNMNMAIQKSSNIYVARLVQRIIERLGTDWYRSVLQQKFGFGLPTGIELPSESQGLLPRPGKLNPNGTLEWSVPTPFSLAMGYNLLLNSIQLTRAYCLLANGGILVQPTLIRKIVKKDSEGNEVCLVDHTLPEWTKSFRRTVDPKLVSRVVEAMRYVMKPGGAGRRGDIWGYTEAGKTGTVHKIANGAYSQTKYVGTFVGFAPARDPAFVLLVVMNEPEKKYIPGVGRNYMSSICAAPVFKAIGTRSLEYLGIPRDDPHGYPYGDPRYRPQLADWVSETKKLQELYDSWNK